MRAVAEATTVMVAAEAELSPQALQTVMYARDLRFLLEREARKTLQLEAANRQLERYAEDLKRAWQEERQRREEVDRAYYDTLLRLSRAAEYRDGETGFHMQRMSKYVRVMGIFYGLPEQEVDELAAAAALHDLGKIGVPDRVLLDPGPLLPQDREIMERHTIIGASLLEGSSSRLMELGRKIALTHHERWDGSGYPQGLHGDEIPLAGRIVMLCDQYDALRSLRPYKPPFCHDTVCRILLEGDDRTKKEHFDPRILDAFRRLHQEFASIFSASADPT